MKRDIDYQKIVPYSHKHSRNYDPKKCLRYYRRKTKRDLNASILFTFCYIDTYYETKRHIENMSKIEVQNNTNVLLNRYEELNKIHKFSFSTSSSVAISFFVSFLFTLLQLPDNKSGMTYFELIQNFIYDAAILVSNQHPLVTLILIPLSITFLSLLMIVPLGILILLFMITDIMYDYNSKYRDIIVPYERKVIIDTLVSYDEKYAIL